MINRRTFLAGTGAVLLVAPLVVEAQQAGKVYRLGILSPGARGGTSTASLLPSKLRAMGYVEGQNLAIEQGFAAGRFDRLPALARDLVERRVDILFALSPIAVQAAKDATKTVPIVMLLIYSDPVELGFVASFARPGGNITGVVLAAERTMAGKRLELLKEAVPGPTRIALLVTTETYSRTQVQWAEKVAPSLGVKLVVVEVRGADYDRAFATIAAEGAHALFVADSTIFATDRVRIIQLAGKYRLPAIYGLREDVEAGGLMAYGGSASKFAERVAVYLDRIFRGANPAELPVERAATFELDINLKTAKALGLTIPPSLLGRADEVIQ